VNWAGGTTDGDGATGPPNWAGGTADGGSAETGLVN
jgi:hypothetical protein